ncbi:HIT family protein [Bacillus sp. SB49]|uniref:HIT family protein n=1 Tax=Bacillus sp. SB49 TaxID=1071080 RepID=UPI000419994B|nr:HIT family protein [Bacillus sp. SB49]QHT48040.1 HIT family protein [Bacillus sp. SB49]
MTICPICEKHKKKDASILYENAHWAVSAGPHASQVLGYYYLEPKRHVENWTDLSVQELTEMGPLVQEVEKVLREEDKAERLYVVTISEAVRHLHLHLIPRSREEEVKGLPLIEQATQQKVKTSKQVAVLEYDRLNDRVSSYLNR